MVAFPQSVSPSLPGWLVLLLAGVSPWETSGTAEKPEADDPDHYLMRRIREGDRQAFRHLFEKWKLPLIGFFHRSTGDYHRAEDLALEVAEKVFRARHDYEPRARFSTWLFQIARNCLRDSWRRKSLVLQSAEDSGEPNWNYPEALDIEDRQTLMEWEEWLSHALTTFPESERTALLLVVQQGMKPAEAAEVLRITPNHLRVLLNRARNRLRKIREEPL